MGMRKENDLGLMTNEVNDVSSGIAQEELEE